MTNPLYSSNALNSASDTNYSALSDAYDGTPTKIAPLLASIRQGARPKKQQAAQYFNWFTNQIAQILSALIGDLAFQGSQTFTYSGPGTTFVVPAGVTFLTGTGCGAGGGGAGGVADTNGTSGNYYCGGGGGGAAQLSTQIVAVTPGETLTVHIGLLGSAGAIDAPGGNGGDTTLTRSGTPIMTFAGGEGGGIGFYSTSPTDYSFGLGGMPTVTGRGNAPNNGPLPDMFLSQPPGAGGAGITKNNGAIGRDGNASVGGGAGGVAGNNGATDAAYPGGGAGGGGGGSAFGAGGHGGTGGNGHASAVGGAGTSGSGAVGFGAGGGGGGGHGCGNAIGATGGTGGGGANGTLTLTWTEYGTR